MVTPHGERDTTEGIGQRLNMRDFIDTLRASGIQSGAPSALGLQDRKAFADQLDRWLSSGHSR